MRTLDSQNLAGSRLTARLRRNSALLLRIGRMMYEYFAVGGGIRRTYRRHERAGTVFWLDEEQVRGPYPWQRSR